MTPRKPNRYTQILERVFFKHYDPKTRTSEFKRDEFRAVADDLGIVLPKNLGDLPYNFRYRYPLPERVLELLEPGEEWVIRPAGRSVYRMEVVVGATIKPTAHFGEIRVPDATPNVISMYRMSDEQALLAILRYNRLIDTFLRITCYSLQSHLRTYVRGMGQVETDELYVGIDRRGAHFIVPVQAKGGRDRMNVVQIEQDFAVCNAKFPNLIARPVGAQFMGTDLIALFEFQRDASGKVTVRDEKHYRLVPGNEIDASDLLRYGASEE